jgi:hypothetical protein
MSMQKIVEYRSGREYNAGGLPLTLVWLLESHLAAVLARSLALPELTNENHEEKAITTRPQTV